MSLPHFIIIEGVHGSGKSTIAQALATLLVKQGYPAKYSHFPDENDILGSAIRSVLTDARMTAQWSVVGALYAAYANRFHIQCDAAQETIYILDRHSVTTGLVFQEDIPDAIREQLYQPGLDILRNSGEVIYLSLDPTIALERMNQRNQELTKRGGVRTDKAEDTFLKKFRDLSARYDEHLIQRCTDRGIPATCIPNDTSIAQTLADICTHFSIPGEHEALHFGEKAV